MAKGKDWNDLHRERPGSIRDLADNPANDIPFEPPPNGDARTAKGNGRPEGADVHVLLDGAIAKAPEPDAAKPPRPSKGKQETSGSCKMTTKGLVWRDPADDEKPPIVVAGQFEIIAESRDDFGSNWGILLRWKDPDGKSREWAMPKSLLAGDGIEVRRALLDGGLYVAAGGKARNLLYG
jgi:hypothetical protein